MKDSICLWSNVNIPCIYVQSENTELSDSAICCLQKRYNHIYITFDGDSAGETDAYNLRLKTGFEIIHCPIIDKAKDWSDIYHYFGKNRLIKEFNEAFNKVKMPDMDNDLPF